MTPEQQDLLKKARKTLNNAKHDFEGGYFEGATSRAYYTMFYTAKALLINENLNLPKKHSGVIASFGKNLANTDKVPREFHRTLIDAEKLRTEADYDVTIVVSQETAEKQINSGEQFLELGNRLIAQPHYQKLYEQYSQNIKARSPVNLTKKVATQALQEDYSKEDVRQILSHDPEVQRVKKQQGEEKASQYIQQMIRSAEDRIKKTRQPRTDQQQRQRENNDDLTL